MVSEEQILNRIKALQELVPELKLVRTEHLRVFFGVEKKKSLGIPKEHLAHVKYDSPFVFAIWIDENYFDKATRDEQDTVLLHEIVHVLLNKEAHDDELRGSTENYLKIVRTKEGR